MERLNLSVPAEDLLELRRFAAWLVFEKGDERGLGMILFGAWRESKEFREYQKRTGAIPRT